MLDLFSGIGGFSLAARWTGAIETVAFVEIDSFCQKVLRKHWPNTPIYDDVKTFNGGGVKKIDIITGGSPCQDFSVNGGKCNIGLTGEKSSLIREFGRIACNLMPSWVIIENVDGIIRFGKEITDLFPYWRLYDKTFRADLFGAYTRRKRTFVVGHLRERGGRNIFDYIRYTPKTFQTGGYRDTLPMCLPWGGGANLERLGSCLVENTKINATRIRKSNGISRRLDKIRYQQLGNSIVPQVVYPIFEAIVKIEGNS
jgi:DNA (cytosine-5)-methyltransferase 1